MVQRLTPPERRSYRWLFWLLALANLSAVVWVVWDETVARRPWKRVQRRFNAALLQARRPPVPIRLRQVQSPQLAAIDRCESCHLGIDRGDLLDAKLPRLFSPHPRRRELLGRNHPSKRFGCTACHGGQGPQTKGVGAAAFDHGHDDPYWEQPLRQSGFVEASCVPCHHQLPEVPGAARYNRGQRLFEDRRCYGCHSTSFARFEGPAAPSLGHIATKSSRAGVERWLQSPRALRPNSRMPDFWPAPRAVDGAPRGAAAQARWRQKRQQQSAAVAAFLGTLRPKRPLPSITLPKGLDAPQLIARGERLFGQLGCRGCHEAGGERGAAVTSARYGPGLHRIGELASARWLAAWLAGPRQVWPQARMPDLRLSEAERTALLAFLVALRARGAAPMKPNWPRSPATQVAEGRRLVIELGCHGCHEIPGLKGAGRAGPGLEGFAERLARHREWGDQRPVCKDREQECWTQQKIFDPRSMSGQRHHARMPDFGLSRAAARDLAVFVLGAGGRPVASSMHARPKDREGVWQRGEALLARFNCRGCHEIGRKQVLDVDEDGDVVGKRFISHGGEIARYFTSRALAPPQLSDAGAKFQYAWVDEFLAAPRVVRPWLTARMPTFALQAKERTALLRYFAQASQRPFPFDPVDRRPLAAQHRQDGTWLFAKLQCYKCHRSSPAGVKLAELAPDLALAMHRLKPAWLRRWLAAPQQIAPGTRMPTYFPLADDDDSKSAITPYPQRLGGSVLRQIDALTRLTLRFGADPTLRNIAPASPAGAGRKP